jgi:hypothetical protein
LDAVFVLEKVHLKKKFHLLELCTSVRRKTTVKLLFTFLCSFVDFERYWTAIDIACVVSASCLSAATKYSHSWLR